MQEADFQTNIRPTLRSGCVLKRGHVTLRGNMKQRSPEYQSIPTLRCCCCTLAHASVALAVVCAEMFPQRHAQRVLYRHV